jgi:hypothetical protein
MLPRCPNFNRSIETSRYENLSLSKVGSFSNTSAIHFFSMGTNMKACSLPPAATVNLLASRWRVIQELSSRVSQNKQPQIVMGWAFFDYIVGSAPEMQ